MRSATTVLLASALLAGCTAGSASPTPTAVPKPTTPVSPVAAPSPSVAATAAPKEAKVEIRGFAYLPPELTVPVGTTVIWTNEDPTPHTVTADDRSYDSGLFGANETFAHTYTAPGRYGYFCIPHGSPGSGMFGTVVVQ